MRGRRSSRVGAPECTHPRDDRRPFRSGYRVRLRDGRCHARCAGARSCGGPRDCDSWSRRLPRRARRRDSSSRRRMRIGSRRERGRSSTSGPTASRRQCDSDGIQSPRAVAMRYGSRGRSASHSSLARPLARACRALAGTNSSLVRPRERRVPSARRRNGPPGTGGAAARLRLVAVSHARAQRDHGLPGIRGDAPLAGCICRDNRAAASATEPERNGRVFAVLTARRLDPYDVAPPPYRVPSLVAPRCGIVPCYASLRGRRHREPGPPDPPRRLRRARVGVLAPSVQIRPDQMASRP
jgi:hypothetical protein